MLRVKYMENEEKQEADLLLLQNCVSIVENSSRHHSLYICYFPFTLNQ